MSFRTCFLLSLRRACTSRLAARWLLAGRAMSMCTTKPSFSKPTSSPRCSAAGPRKPKSMDRIVACGVGRPIGDATGATVKVVFPAILPSASPTATYCPGASVVWTSLPASTCSTSEPNLPAPFGSWPALLLANASSSAELTPGFSRTIVAPASFAPVPVVTTLTAPACGDPPTLTEDFVRATLRDGSVAASAVPVASSPPAEARMPLTATRADMAPALKDLLAFQRCVIRRILSFEAAGNRPLPRELHGQCRVHARPNSELRSAHACSAA